MKLLNNMTPINRSKIIADLRANVRVKDIVAKHRVTAEAVRQIRSSAGIEKDTIRLKR